MAVMTLKATQQDTVKAQLADILMHVSWGDIPHAAAVLLREIADVLLPGGKLPQIGLAERRVQPVLLRAVDAQLLRAVGADVEVPQVLIEHQGLEVVADKMVGGTGKHRPLRLQVAVVGILHVVARVPLIGEGLGIVVLGKAGHRLAGEASFGVAELHEVRRAHPVELRELEALQGLQVQVHGDQVRPGMGPALDVAPAVEDQAQHPVVQQGHCAGVFPGEGLLGDVVILDRDQLQGPLIDRLADLPGAFPPKDGVFHCHLALPERLEAVQGQEILCGIRLAHDEAYARFAGKQISTLEFILSRRKERDAELERQLELWKDSYRKAAQ